jgi:hypothetical protein
MGRLIVSAQMTVDGVIDVGEWYVAEGEHDRASKDQLAQASAVLLGCKTYEGLAAHWSPLKDDWANLIIASRTLHGPLGFAPPVSHISRVDRALDVTAFGTPSQTTSGRLARPLRAGEIPSGERRARCRTRPARD